MELVIVALVYTVAFLLMDRESKQRVDPSDPRIYKSGWGPRYD